MPGQVKRKYNSKTGKFAKDFTRPLKLISEALPAEYDKDLLLKMFKELYPINWEQLCKRYKYYENKDKHLMEVGKKKRYFHDKPEIFFFRLAKVKHLLSKGQRLRHKKNFNADKAEKAYKELLNKANKRKCRYNHKMEAKNNELQIIEPIYLDIFIFAYHRKGVEIREKIEIVNELKKYKSEKIITFFQKLNDSERNNQVRKIAFEHLQAIGEYVELRKNFKGKQKAHHLDRDDFNVSPEDLLQRIQSNSVQNKKSYHVFISHSYKDTELVQKLKNCLNKNKLSVYCDWISDNDFLKRDLVSDYTKAVLKKRIEQSKVVLLLETNNSVENSGSFSSTWIQMEIDYANQISKPIYHLNIEENDSSLEGIGFTMDNGELIMSPNETLQLRKSFS